jgi:PIN domain nuclease of toxin-antitoxin system
VNDLLADTHIAVWCLFEPARLSAAALQALHDTQTTGGRILVSAITLIEATYLAEKGRLAPAVLPGLWSVIADPSMPFDAIPIAADVARTLDRIPRGSVPDMPDRIIAATALAFGIPLASADRRIRALAVPGLTVVW